MSWRSYWLSYPSRAAPEYKTVVVDVAAPDDLSVGEIADAGAWHGYAATPSRLVLANLNDNRSITVLDTTVTPAATLLHQNPSVGSPQHVSIAGDRAVVSLGEFGVVSYPLDGE